MTFHYCCYCYYRYCNPTYYRQVAAGAGSGLSVASHELHGQSVNAEYRGDSDGR